jgi:response regulator RpfG family c-di-GMP phosphodiesterase
VTLKQQHTLLFVDDEKSIIKSLQRLFRKEGYDVLTASGGKEALEVLKTNDRPVSLIISDQRMPEMEGAQFLEQSKQFCPDAARFLLTGYSDMDAVIHAVNRGEIQRYLTKPWNDDDLLLQVRQALEHIELQYENRRLVALIAKQNKELNQLNKGLEEKVAQRTQEIQKQAESLKQANRALEQNLKSTIGLLSSLVDTLNPDLGKLMRYVAVLSREIATSLELTGQQIDQIEMAGLIHDLGLLGVPEDIIYKDIATMDDDEFKAFSQHPLIAAVCLEGIENLSEVAKIVLQHHEQINGGGFPNGLRGEEITLGARIIAPVAEYCRIMSTWPKDPKAIAKRAARLLNTSPGQFVIKAPEEMLHLVAEKSLLLGSNQLYDMDIITILLKQANKMLGKDGNTYYVMYNKLQEGMVLADDLRLKDGRLLLLKGTRLKASSITAIISIAERNLLSTQIHVTQSPDRAT